MKISKTKLFLVLVFFSSLSHAKVTFDGIENLYELLPSGEYQGINQSKDPCTVEVLENGGDTQTLYSISVSPDNDGLAATFTIAQGMNGQVGVANASTFGVNSLNVLQITGSEDKKSVVVQNKIGDQNSKAFCSIEF